MNWWEMAPVPTAGALYRPVTAATYNLDVLLMGLDEEQRENRQLDVSVLHWTNNAGHVIVCLLAFALLTSLFSSPEGSSGNTWMLPWLGSLLFATHPVHVEAVTGIVGRAEVLMSVFFLAAVLLWRHGEARYGAVIGSEKLTKLWLCRGAVLLLWALSILSKEMGITLPAMLVLLDLVDRRRTRRSEWLMAYGPFLVTGCLYMLVRHLVLGSSSLTPYEAMQASEVSYWQRFMTMCHAFLYYWRLVLWGAAQSADYGGFPISRSLGPPALLGLLIHGILIIGSLWLLVLQRSRRSNTAVLGALGTLGFYGLLFPVSNLVINTGVIVSPRALYLPSLWCIVLVMALLTMVAERWRNLSLNRSLWGLGLAIVVSNIYLCRQANEIWANEERLYGATVKSPYCGHIGFSGRARTLIGSQQYELGLAFANRSIAVRLNLVNLEYRAKCLMGLKRYAEAIAPLRALVRNNPHQLKSVRRLLRCYHETGQLAQAVEYLRQRPEISDPGKPFDAVMVQLQAELSQR